MKSAEGRRYSDRDGTWCSAREQGGRSRSCWQSSGWFGIRDGVADCVLWDLFWRNKTEAISLALRHRNETRAQGRNGLLHQLDLITITFFPPWNLRDYIRDLKSWGNWQLGGERQPYSLGTSRCQWNLWCPKPHFLFTFIDGLFVCAHGRMESVLFTDNF